jgi:protein-S-isoprenylcysteine O-methyltransferase Ste14
MGRVPDLLLHSRGVGVAHAHVRYGLALLLLTMTPGALLLELRDRFGEEYVRYCARVPRSWPW